MKLRPQKGMVIGEALFSIQEEGGVFLICGMNSPGGKRMFAERALTDCNPLLSMPPRLAVSPDTMSREGIATDTLLDDSDVYVSVVSREDVDVGEEPSNLPPRQMRSDGGLAQCKFDDVVKEALHNAFRQDSLSTEERLGVVVLERLIQAAHEVISTTPIPRSYAGRPSAPRVVCSGITDLLTSEAYSTVEPAVINIFEAIRNFGAVGFFMVDRPFSSDVVDRLSSIVDGVILLRDVILDGAPSVEQQIVIPGANGVGDRAVMTDWVSIYDSCSTEGGGEEFPQ